MAAAIKRIFSLQRSAEEAGAGPDIPTAVLHARFNAPAALTMSIIHPMRLQINTFLERLDAEKPLFERAKQRVLATWQPPAAASSRLLALPTAPTLDELAALGIRAAQLFDPRACGVSASEFFAKGSPLESFDAVVTQLQLTLDDVLPPLDAPSRLQDTRPSPEKLLATFYAGDHVSFRERMTQVPFSWSPRAYAVHWAGRCAFHDLDALGVPLGPILARSATARTAIKPWLRAVFSSAPPSKWAATLGVTRSVLLHADFALGTSAKHVAHALGWNERETAAVFFSIAV